MKRLIVSSLFILLSAISVFGQTEKYSLNELIELATENSPQLESIRNKIKADKSRSIINSNLPDPLISFGFSNIPVNSFSFTQEPMTGKMISLSQSIPFPGKLNEIENLNNFDALISFSELKEDQSKISFQVKNLFFMLYYSLKENEVLKDKKELIIALSEILNSRFQNSLSSQKDVILNDYQKSLIDEKLIEIKSNQDVILSSLSILVNKQLSFAEIDFETLEENSTVNLNLVSVENNPSIHKLSNLISKSKKRIEIAEYEFYPDFRFTIQYTQRDWIEKTKTNLDDFVSFVVGFNLPINFGGKKTAVLQEAEFSNKYLLEKQNSIKQELSISLQSATTKYKSLQKRKTLINNELIEKANLNYKTTLSAYQNGRASFNDVIESINLLFDSKLKKEKIQTEINRTTSEIVYLSGIEFEEMYK